MGAGFLTPEGTGPWHCGSAHEEKRLQSTQYCSCLSRPLYFLNCQELDEHPILMGCEELSYLGGILIFFIVIELFALEENPLLCILMPVLPQMFICKRKEGRAH